MSFIGRLLDRVLFWGGFAGGTYVAYFNTPAAMKSAVAALSNNPNARQLLRDSGLTAKLSKRFAAADSVEQALALAQTLNSQGIGVTFRLLQTPAEHAPQALEAKNDYLALIGRIADRSLKATIVLPLVHIGLVQTRQFARNNLTELLDAAKAAFVHVALDVDSAEHVQPTLDLFHDMRSAGYDNVAFSSHVNLRRSSHDIESLIFSGAHVRLTEGGKLELPDAEMRLRLDNAVRRLLSPHAAEKGATLTLNSSNNHVLQVAFDALRATNRPKSAIKIEIPYGERPDLPPHLVNEGYSVSIMLPVGTNTDPYIMERIQADPTLLLNLLE